MAFFKVLKALDSKKPPACSVVIAAAGDSRRCEGEDKLLYCVNGKPILAHTISAFEECESVSEIIVVVKAEQLNQISVICKHHDFDKVTKIMVGGETRMQSVYNGIFAVSRKAKLIAIHDGARPCIDESIIRNTINAAAKYHAAAPGIEVIPTLKRAVITDNHTKNASETKLKNQLKRGDIIIKETVDRNGLYEIQTPQVFRAELIKAALTNAVKKNIALTDDCMAAEIIGASVHIVEGSRRNIKITLPDDLPVAEVFLA